jgi:transposase
VQSIQSTIADALPPTMTVDAAAAFLGISRSTAYTLSARYRETAGQEGLPNIRLGARVLVLTTPLLELIRVSTHGVSGEQAFVTTAALTAAPPSPDAA